MRYTIKSRKLKREGITMQDKHKTKVIFRKFKDGEVIALFPELQANDNHAHCQSYMHVGQHGSANYDVNAKNKLATESEYKDLKEELESIGYNLDVRKRITKRWFEVKGQ